MKILHELISQLPSHAVNRVIVGVFTTLVSSKNSGLASTLKNNFHTGIGVKNGGKLIGMDVRELSEYSLSDSLTEASLGMAAINSALPFPKMKTHRLNAKDLILQKGRGKTVGVIGHFPFLEKVGDEFKKLLIFEKNPREGDLSEDDISNYLPLADVVAITGTAFSNHTLENILKHRKKDSYTVVLGPSTPLSPILFDYGIDAVCGANVNNPQQVFSYIKEAVPFRHISGIDYLTILKDEFKK